MDKGLMPREQFRILVKGMKAVYTQDTFIPDADAFQIWYALLGDLDYRVLNAAIQKYMLTNKFPPTIADLREIAATIENGELPDWGEAWESVLRVIRRYGSYGEAEAMASLDELTRSVVRRLGFRNLCMSENINQDRANFRMIYEQVSERARSQNALPIALNNTIKLLNKNNVNMLEFGAGGFANGEYSRIEQR